MITLCLFVLVSIFSCGEAASWPDGTYCLPMPSNQRCPIGWKKGERRHDTEDSTDARYCNKKHYGWAPYHYSYCYNLAWGFCCKTRNYPRTGKTWPKGSYCIFRKGGHCPKGFDSGYLHWDDEDNDNVNRVSGVVPDGNYGRDTDIYFCCRDDPSRFLSYSLRGLPKCSEMIVMRFKGTCPSHGIGYRGPHTGYLQWDTEDNRNKDRRVRVFPDGEKTFGTGIKIEFCSYTSGSSC